MKIEKYGIDLTDCLLRAKKNGSRELYKYLAVVNGWEYHQDQDHADEIQACYDGLAACYSATNGGTAWRTMDIGLEALKK